MKRWPYERVVVEGTWELWHTTWKSTYQLPWLLRQRVGVALVQQRSQWRDITHA